MRKAANNAYKPEEKEELMKQSKEHLDLFLKEKPNHPEAVSAMAWWAGFITDKAMDYMRATKDPALKGTGQGQGEEGPVDGLRPRGVSRGAAEIHSGGR